MTRTAKPVSDLVEQLQHAAAHEPYSGLYEDAAAAIVSLRADVARLAAVLDDIAEKRMPEFRPDGSRWWFNGGEGFAEWAQAHAAAALINIARGE